MRKESLLPICTAVVGGAFGFFARWLQLSTAIDESTGLMRGGAAASRILIALCVVVAAVQLLYTLRARDRLPEAPGPEFFEGGSAVYRFFCAGMGLLTAVGGVLLLIGAMRGSGGALTFFLALLAVFAGLCMAALSLSATAAVPVRCLCCTVPVLFLCFWMIVTYKENASNPVVWSFCTRILAIAANALGWFYLAGLAYGKPKSAALFFFCQLAPFLSILSLADSVSLGSKLALLCPSLLLLAVGARLAGERKENA